MRRNQPPEPLMVGDRVEWRPHYTGTATRIGESGVVVGFNGPKALVLFEDGEKLLIWRSNLAWIPSPEQIAADKERLKLEHLERLRGMNQPVVPPPGNPHEAPHLDAEAYHDSDGC